MALQISSTSATRRSTPSTRSTSTCCKGDGAAGMGLTFDTPDGACARRARRALRPRGARAWRRRADGLTQTLPAAARGALPRRLAADGAGRRLLADDPEGQGPPAHRPDDPADAPGPRPRTTRPSSSRYDKGRSPRPAADRRAACRSSRRPTMPAGLRGVDAGGRRSAPAPTRSRGSSRAASSSSSACRITGPGPAR